MPALRNVGRNKRSQRSGEPSPMSPCKEERWHYTDTILPAVIERLKVEVDLEPYDGLGALGSSCSSGPSTPSSCSPITPSDVAPPPAPTSRKSRKDHIPRPRNAFIIFRSQYVKLHLNEDKERQNELSKVVGRVWQSMSAMEKAPFCELACLEKDNHVAMYPDYVFAPKRKSKNNKTRNTSKKRTPKKTQAYCETSSEFSSPALSEVRPSPPAASTHAEEGFISTSNIPTLELSPHNSYDYSSQIVESVPDPHTPYHNPPELHLSPYQMTYHFQAQDPTLPPLPLSNTADEVSFPYPTPGSSLLFDNPYPSADYVDPSYSFDATAYNFMEYSYGFDGQVQQPQCVLPDDRDSISTLQLTSLSNFDGQMSEGGQIMMPPVNGHEEIYFTFKL